MTIQTSGSVAHGASLRLPPPFLPGHALLRGVAAIVVFLAHAQFAALWSANDLASGIYERLFYWHNVAVDVFFALSGFILFHVHRPEKPAHWRSYFVARIARIYPLYLDTTALALLIFGLGQIATDAPFLGGWTPTAIVKNFLGVQQWSATAGVGNSINFPAWSVSVELLLYLSLYPAFRYLFRRTVISAHWAIALSALALACNVCIQFSMDSNYGLNLIFRGVTAFAGGAFLFRAINASPAPALSKTILIASICAFAISAINVVPRELLPLIALPLLYQLSLLQIANAKIETICRSLGDLSFAIYLIHLPAIKLILLAAGLWGMEAGDIVSASLLFKSAYIAITLAVVFGGAFLTHKFLEKPARQAIKSLLS